MNLHSRLRKQMPSLTPQWAGDREGDLRQLMQRSVARQADDAPQLKPQQQPAPQVSSLPPMVDPENPETQANRSAASESIANPRIHLGTSTKGLQGVERDLARVQAARDYDSQGLNFKVRPDSVDMQPPDPHTDWKDRLKSGLKTAVISMANVKRSNPDASATELLAGGATGGAIGAISRDTGDAMFRRAQIEDMEGQLGPQIAREGALAKMGQMQQPDKPIFVPRNVAEGEYDLPEGTEIRQQIDPKTGQAKDVVGPDGKPVVVNRPRKPTERTVRPIFRDRKNKDGSTTVMRSDDNGKTFTEDKSLGSEAPAEEPDETPQQARERQGKYEAAKKMLEGLSARERKAEQVKNQAWTAYQKAKEQGVGRKYSDGTPIPVDAVDSVVAAKKAYDDAEKEFQSYWGEKDKALAEMKQYEPRASQSIRGSQSDTRKGTISKEQQQRWLDDNQGKTLDDMKKLYPNAVMQ